MLTFQDICSEVKRRATRDQGGTQFDIGIKTVVNSSLFRLAREAFWRVLRRRTSFTTITSYTTGTGAAEVTNGDNTVTVTGATFLTDQVKIRRRVKFSGSGKFYYINQITGETTLELDLPFDGTSSTTNDYEILPQEEYNLPAEVSHRMFMWHEMYGYPFKMQYITDQDFYSHSAYLSIKYIPTHYRMWGEDMILKQLNQPSVVTVVSSIVTDTTIPITVFGMVSGYPDYEIIYTDTGNGTTTSTGLKTFQSVERISKGTASVGRITASGNSGNDTLAVMPVGDISAGILYKKVQLYALPLYAQPINVQYYKDPYRLVNDNDIHELGQEFDEALILLATSKLKAEQNLNTEADRFLILYANELSSLRGSNCDKIDWFPSLKRPGQSGNQDMLTGGNLLYRQAGPNFGRSSRY
jgi:hypothetical protein